VIVILLRVPTAALITGKDSMKVPVSVKVGVVAVPGDVTDGETVTVTCVPTRALRVA
jgi:hypothetical protein